jgi:hypothetical protein
VTRFNITIIRPWKRPLEKRNACMNNKDKGLSFGRSGMIGGNLRRNRGRREASLPFSKTILGDSHLLKSLGRLKGVSRCQGFHL